MIATGFPVRTEARAGREAQSMAFFSTPGTQWLYSGVAMSSASASRMARLKAATDGGSPCASTSALKSGRSARSIGDHRRTGRRHLDGRPDQPPVVRPASEAPRDAEDGEGEGRGRHRRTS